MPFSKSPFIPTYLLTITSGAVLAQPESGRAVAPPSLRPVVTAVAAASVSVRTRPAVEALVGAVATVVDAVTGQLGVQTGAVTAAELELGVTVLCKENGQR